jgi:hypothetical protein
MTIGRDHQRVAVTSRTSRLCSTVCSTSTLRPAMTSISAHRSSRPVDFPIDDDDADVQPGQRRRRLTTPPPRSLFTDGVHEIAFEPPIIFTVAPIVPQWPQHLSPLCVLARGPPPARAHEDVLLSLSSASTSPRSSRGTRRRARSLPTRTPPARLPSAPSVLQRRPRFKHSWPKLRPSRSRRPVARRFCSTRLASPLPAPEIRQKPDFSCVDGVDTTFFGSPG